MNFIGNKLIPAAFFAATASVVISAPAQALSLSGGTTITDILVEVTDDGTTLDDESSFNFFPGDDEVPFGFQTGSSGDFTPGVFFVGIGGPLDIAGGSLVTDLTPFFSGIETSAGLVDFVLTDISDYEETFGTTPGTKGFEFDLIGYFVQGEERVGGTGIFNSTITVENGLGAMNASLVTAVPTPAAVLPVIAGLFGAASRKNEEEEA